LRAREARRAEIVGGGCMCKSPARAQIGRWWCKWHAGWPSTCMGGFGGLLQPLRGRELWVLRAQPPPIPKRPEGGM